MALLGYSLDQARKQDYLNSHKQKKQTSGLAKLFASQAKKATRKTGIF